MSNVNITSQILYTFRHFFRNLRLCGVGLLPEVSHEVHSMLA